MFTNGREDLMTEAVDAIDSGLDTVEPLRRLEFLEDGIYTLELTGVKRVDGDNGIYDIFETKVADSKGDGAAPVGAERKIMIQRNLTGWKKEKREQDLVSLLTAVNGGETLTERGQFLADLRSKPIPPGTKFKVRISDKFKQAFSPA